MPVDGSDIPLRMLNISLKLPLLETQQLMMNQSRSFRPPKCGRGLLVHLPSKLRGINRKNHRNVILDHYSKNCLQTLILMTN